MFRETHFTPVCLGMRVHALREREQPRVSERSERSRIMRT